MPALTPGTPAPDFTLQAHGWKAIFILEALTHGPVIAAFFKISCPTCQYAFPFLQRLYEAHGAKRCIVGISQNEKKDTAAFIKQYGVTFPILLEDTHSYPVSNAYGLTQCAFDFLDCRGWRNRNFQRGLDPEGIEELNQRAAASAGDGHVSLFQPGEPIADFRAG